MKELSGIPLALEQAGALIRDGEFSFSNFYSAYKTEYRRLMENDPQEGTWSYDKNRSILTILDMTYSAIARKPEHAALLDFIGVLGSWQIPISLIEGFQLTSIDSPSPIEEDLTMLNFFFRNPGFLRLALHRLARLCVIKLKEEGGHIKSFMIHKVICQWCVDNVVTTHKQIYIIQAAYGLAKQIFVPVATNHPVLDVRDLGPRRNYLAPLENCISLVRGYLLPDLLDSQQRRFLETYTIIAIQVARAYLSVSLTEEAMKYFHEAIELETIRATEEDIQWPNSEMSLCILSGLARAYQKMSNLEKALETLNAALSLSERLYGSIDETTVAIVSRLKEVSERQEVMQRHHKSAVVASTDARISSKVPESTQQSSGSYDTFLQQSTSSAPIELNAGAEGDEDSDLQGESIADVLQGAAYEGDEAMVTFLLGLPNINADSKDGRGRTPLWMASWKGHVRVVELLLKRNTVEVDVGATDLCTPLVIAATEGHAEVVKLLLETGKVDVNTKHRRGWTPLERACWEGFEEVVRLLLDAGADANAQGGIYGDALYAASYRGYEKIVKLLLDAGANANAQGGVYSNALQAASHHGYEQIVKLLLDAGANANAQGGFYGNALQAASYNGYEQAVKLLLDTGADANAQGGYYSNALEVVLYRGHEKVVRLLNAGADTNAQGGVYSNALQTASHHGYEQIVKLLLDAGANADAQGGIYGNALQAASHRGHEKVMRLLLDKEADINEQGGRYSSVRGFIRRLRVGGKAAAGQGSRPRAL